MFGEYDFAVIYDHRALLWKGLQFSFLLAGVGIGGGILFGTLLALMRLSPLAPISVAAGAYVNSLRATPLILVIFWFYFVVPLLIPLPVGALYSAMITFVMFEAAYYCEIIRAGIQSITRGQVHAGQALGLTYRQSMQYVVLPQAFRNMVPVLLTQAIVLFQDTSLVFVIGLKEFLTTADLIFRIQQRPVEMFTFAALVYLVICSLGSLGIRRLQRRYAP